jgi:hypothetical protein
MGARRHFEVHFHNRKLPKVTRSGIRRVWWLGAERNGFLYKKLLHKKRCAARHVIVMQKPLSLPLVASLPPNCISQPLQNLQVEMTGNFLSRWCEIVVHQTFGVRELKEISDCPSKSSQSASRCLVTDLLIPCSRTDRLATLVHNCLLF